MLLLRRAAVALAARSAGQASKAAAAGPSSATAALLRAPHARFGSTPVRRLAEQAGKEGEAAEAAGGWLKGFAKSKIRLIAAAALGVLALNAGASAAFDVYYQKTVLDTLMRGVLPPPQAPPLLARDELRQRMQELLAPPEPSSFFHIVTGPPGGGKSTLLREAVRSVGAGVGYIEVSPAYDVDWGRDLGETFGFRFQEHVKAANVVAKPILGTQYEDPHSKHPLASVRQSAEALHDAALEFRKRTGRPFVLVIDSADRLAHGEDSDRVLRAMVEYARDWAQEGAITTVFVAADWATVERLAGDHPAQSRAAPPLRVPDISGDEALHYLEALGVEGKLAGQCAELVGGSLLLLQRCAYMTGAGLPFSEVKQQLLELVEIAYVQAGLLDETPQREGGLSAVEALLKSRSGAVGAAEWRTHVPAREQQQELLSRGVIRFDGRQLSFASRLAATYAAEALAGRLPPAVADRHRGLRRPGWW